MVSRIRLIGGPTSFDGGVAGAGRWPASVDVAGGEQSEFLRMTMSAVAT
jgi:hypothetical protein